MLERAVEALDLIEQKVICDSLRNLCQEKFTVSQEDNAQLKGELVETKAENNQLKADVDEQRRKKRAAIIGGGSAGIVGILAGLLGWITR